MRSVLLYTICACTLLLYGCNTSSLVRINYPPTSTLALQALHVDVASYEKRFSADHHPSVFLVWEQDQEIGKQASRYYVHTTHRQQYLVLDPSNEWLSQFRPNLEKNETLDKAVISIRYPDGTVQQFTEKDMRVEKGSEYTSYKLAYPNVSRGTVIEEWYTTILWHKYGYLPDNHEKKLQFSVPADTVRYRFISPDGSTVQVRQMTANERVPYTVHIDDTAWVNVLTYEKAHVPATHNEPYSPYDNEYRDGLDFRLSSIASGFSNQGIQSWEQFADGYKVLLTSSAFNLNDAEDIVDSLTASCKTDEEKLRAIVAHVQREYQSDNDAVYWAINGQMLGNNTEITCFTIWLLRLADIEAELVFIQPEQEGYFDPTFYSGYQFYSPALYADIGGKPFFALPYWKHVAVGLLPDNLQNRPALRITESGFNGFRQTPQSDSAINTTDERFVVTIGTDGKAIVEEERRLRGFDAQELRDQLYELNPEECTKELRDMATYIDGNTRFLSQEVAYLNEADSVLVIKLRYEVDNLVAMANNTAILQTAGLLAPQSLTTAPAVPKRHNPVKVRVPWTKNLDITIRYPQQWNLRSVPNNYNVANRFGVSSGSFQSAPGVLTATLRQEVHRADGKAEEYRALLDIIGDQAKPAVPPLVFSAQGL